MVREFSAKKKNPVSSLMASDPTLKYSQSTALQDEIVHRFKFSDLAQNGQIHETKYMY